MNQVPRRKSKSFSNFPSFLSIDFDDDDDEPAVKSADERKQKHSSLPPPKQHLSRISRRGSDSELKKSYTVTRQIKPKNEPPKRRKENTLPYIRPQPIRPAAFPIRRHKEILSSSAKNEKEEREASAKTNDLKRLESRIAELRRQLEEQRIENSTLRTIQRREEKAIKKYEEKEYDIHRIIRDYTHEIDYIKDVLSNERETKARMEKQIENRDEVLRDRTERLKKYEKIVQEKHLDERYELQKKLEETDKKLQTYQEKLANQVSQPLIQYIRNIFSLLIFLGKIY
jgi:DNA repair exonuclease SbcCD ATPase subunit